MLLVPFPSYKLSARCVNNYHLALALLTAETISVALRVPGYTSDVAVAMWKDDPGELHSYARYLRDEAKVRGLDCDTGWVKDTLSSRSPWWLGDDGLHKYHRGLLHKRDPAFYTAMYIRVGAGIVFAPEPDYCKIVVENKISKNYHWINSHG